MNQITCNSISTNFQLKNLLKELIEEKERLHEEINP